MLPQETRRVSLCSAHKTLKCTMCASVGITVQLNAVCSRCSMTVLGTLAATELLVNSVTGGKSADAHTEQLTC